MSNQLMNQFTPPAQIPNWNGPIPQTNCNPMPPYQMIPPRNQMMPSNVPLQMQNPQPQPMPQSYGVAGRLVASEQDIRPNDIPMDGSVSWFPQTDGGCIYAKQWMADGTIRTTKYIPYIAPEPQQFQPIQNNDISSLEARVAKLESLMQKKNSRSNKTEVTSDEQ